MELQLWSHVQPNFVKIEVMNIEYSRIISITFHRKTLFYPNFTVLETRDTVKSLHDLQKAFTFSLYPTAESKLPNNCKKVNLYPLTKYSVFVK